MQNQLPKYHETFIPILEVLSNGKVIRSSDLEKQVRDKYYSNLSQELLNQKTKSGAILILNRIGWGKAYLKQAGMIVQPERAMIQITNKGKEVARRGRLTLKELLSDKVFLANQKKNEEDKEAEEISEEASPQDMIDIGFRKIDSQVKIDLLEKLKAVDPYHFQKVVLHLLKKMGYGDPIATPKSGDGGIDGIINQDEFGFDKIYIQAKRYTENKVREGDIRNFIGAMSRDTNKGVFVTTSTFDERAIEKARDASQKIILIDGIKLANLMYKFSVGLQTKDIYEVKQIDDDFFETE